MARAGTALPLDIVRSPVWRNGHRRALAFFAIGLLAGAAVGGSWLASHDQLASGPLGLYAAAFGVGLVVAWGRGPYLALVPAAAFLAVPAWLNEGTLAGLGTPGRAGVLVAALIGGLVASGVNPNRRTARRSLAEARIARRRLVETQGAIDTVAARVRELEVRLSGLDEPASRPVAGSLTDRRQAADELARALTVNRVGLAAAGDRLLEVERSIRRPEGA